MFCFVFGTWKETTLTVNQNVWSPFGIYLLPVSGVQGTIGKKLKYRILI